MSTRITIADDDFLAFGRPRSFIYLRVSRSLTRWHCLSLDFDLPGGTPPRATPAYFSCRLIISGHNTISARRLEEARRAIC